VASYSTKAIRQSNLMENIILSGVFSSSRVQ
jgi:hypothetical protein